MNYFFRFTINSFLIILCHSAKSSDQENVIPSSSLSNQSAKISKRPRYDFIDNLIEPKEKRQRAAHLLSDGFESLSDHPSRYPLQSINQASQVTTTPYNKKVLSAKISDFLQFQEGQDELEKEFLENTEDNIGHNITYEYEERVGNRRYVEKFLKNEFTIPEEDQEADHWHRTSITSILEIIKCFTKEKKSPPETNYLLARITYKYKNKSDDVQRLPYIFASGLPGNNHLESYSFLSSILKEITGFEEYGLMFLTQSFRNGTFHIYSREKAYYKIQEELEKLYIEINEDHLESLDNPIDKLERLKSHLERIKQNPHLYFHSEQALRRHLMEDNILEREASKSDIRNFFKSSSPRVQEQIEFIILDVCSRYDMCLCCGDTWFTACLLKKLGTKVYIRFSSFTEYTDILRVERGQNIKAMTPLRRSPKHDPISLRAPYTYNPYCPYHALKAMGEEDGI